MVTETDALGRLSLWLKEKNWDVIQDKKNSFDNKCFHIKGESIEKPDLIARKNNYILAIEVKSGSKSNDLGQHSTKIISYFENYNDGRTFYFDEMRNIIAIDDFVVATYFSPDGHFFENESLHKNGTRKDGIQYNACPRIEYGRTFDIIRRVIWDNIQKDKYRKYATGIGALLSSVLDFNDEVNPAIFLMKPNPRTHKWRPVWNEGASL